MNVLRQFVTSNNGILTIQLPIEYQKKNLEVIILPVNDEIIMNKKHTKRLAEAHLAIDEGGGVENPANFLAEFEQNRLDRSLPFARFS